MPVMPVALADNPACLGPAGTVHCALRDWARFAALHACGDGQLLRPETLKKLHTPPAGESYALGWGTRDEAWAGGRLLTHAGSNGMWYALIYVAPERDLALLVATNVMGERGPAATRAVLDALVERITRAE
jgi:CubicO group peptidase (beta-lactamase class C family)